MHTIIVFDLDGTLCPVGREVLPEDAALIKELEQSGFRLALCSGKPTYYLCGFARQLGLRTPILIGENGCTFHFGTELPPVQNYCSPCDETIAETVAELKRRIISECGSRVWFQPNEVMLTPFPRDEKAFDDIEKVLEKSSDLLEGFNIYRHHDSFDITPRGIDKGTALKYLSVLLQKDRSEFIAVGDGENDVPMFRFADISISLHHRLDYRADHEFEQLREALYFLKDLRQRENAL